MVTVRAYYTVLHFLPPLLILVGLPRLSQKRDLIVFVPLIG